jgi:hypothetical protein
MRRRCAANGSWICVWIRRRTWRYLAIEVDVTHRSIKRMPIYATLRVPEVWRVTAGNLTFNVLQPDGQYLEQTHSLAFPQFTPADLLVFLPMRSLHDENEVVRQFVRLCSNGSRSRSEVRSDRWPVSIVVVPVPLRPIIAYALLGVCLDQQLEALISEQAK